MVKPGQRQQQRHPVGSLKGRPIHRRLPGQVGKGMDAGGGLGRRPAGHDVSRQFVGDADEEPAMAVVFEIVGTAEPADVRHRPGPGVAGGPPHPEVADVRLELAYRPGQYPPGPPAQQRRRKPGMADRNSVPGPQGIADRVPPRHQQLRDSGLVQGHDAVRIHGFGTAMGATGHDLKNPHALSSPPATPTPARRHSVPAASSTASTARLSIRLPVVRWS